MSSGGSPVRAVLYALAANFGIFLAKAIAALFTSSASMLAEAVHSLADCGNQILLLRGMREAARPADAAHPLGYGKAQYFWAFLVAILLFSMGGVFSVAEGISKLKSPEPMKSPLLAILVLGVAVVLEAFSLWGCVREIRAMAGSRSLLRFFFSSRSSALVVVLGEDVAALAGLVLAFVAVLLYSITHNPVYDALGSLAIGVLLMGVAAAIGAQMKAFIVGQSAAPEVIEQIRNFVGQRPEVREVLHVITLQLGDDVMVAIKVRMDFGGTANALVDSINTVERALRAHVPSIRWLFFEPDREA